WPRGARAEGLRIRRAEGRREVPGALEGTAAAGARLVLQEHARCASEPHAGAAGADAADDPRPQPRTPGADGRRRARLRGVPATVPRARGRREELGRATEAARAGHGGDAFAVVVDVSGHAVPARGAPWRGLQRPGPPGCDERAR